MQAAIELQKFEEAAELRDQIKKLESEESLPPDIV